MQLRLSHKIISISVLGGLGVLILGGIYLFGEASQSLYRTDDARARKLGALQGRFHMSLLEVRRVEKDFLLRRDEEYLRQHQKFSAEATGLLDELRRQSSVLSQGDLNRQLDTLRTGYADYEKHFAALSAARIKLGLSEDRGLEGSLRDSVHQIEAALKAFDAPRLMLTMLMMRRHEKDFMLRGEAKSRDDMKNRAVEFSTQLAASDIPAETKAGLMQKLAAYQREFFAWADTAQLVAAEQNAASAGFAAIEPVIAAVEQIVTTSSEQARLAELAARDATKLQMEVAIAVIVASVGLLGLLISRSVSRPLTAMIAAMTRLSAGDTSGEIPGIGKPDEIGEIAGAVQSFRDNMIDTERLRTERSEVEQSAAARRRSDMNKLANDFESAVVGIIETVLSASADLEASARTLTSTADRSQEVATMVAAASEEASGNVQSVASATEEMASSVDEISRQVQESARIANDAVDQARKTNDRVGELSKAAARIGDVVELINTIAGQTNLLALNATIEAARAGEAGRGFAVVASEVKALAEQTAKATGEIGQQISGIQAATQESVNAIREISGTIEKLSEISSTIASAVEQQGAATQEISRNVQQAAQGTEQVSSNITDVQRGATETGSASSQVLSAAQTLSRDSNRLKTEVGKFLSTVRAA
jgi:methyl-accepting chemotaxis protein